MWGRVITRGKTMVLNDDEKNDDRQECPRMKAFENAHSGIRRM